MPSDALVLGFDTSAAHCAAALLSGDRLLAARTEPMARGQAERLMPLLQEVLAEAGRGWSDLDRIGVGTGPGNFTGIRISVAAARGLALSLNVPAIGVTTFEALARGLPGPVTATVRAPQDRLYLQRFGPDGADAPVLQALETLPSDPDAPQLWVGDLAEACRDRLGGTATRPLYPLAEAIARVAAAAPADTAPPAPLYLRAADAAPPRDAPPEIVDDL